MAPASLVVTSPVFDDGGPIPAKYTAAGPGVSPPLAWRGIPATARGIAIVIEDADSPSPMPIVHGIAVHLPPLDGELEEGALRELSPPVVVGRNSIFSASWLPPDPPLGHGAHRYVFQVFAIDRDFELGPHPGRTALVDALAGHTVARGVLVGTYRRGS